MKTKQNYTPGPTCECGPSLGRWYGRHGRREYLCPDCYAERLKSCITKLHGTLADIMPQIGKLVLQDYQQLNEGLIEAEQILHQ